MGKETQLRGINAPLVREAIETKNPLPGTVGFAGAVDNRLVRDVLGREPLFLETSPTADGPDWSFDPTLLTAPELVPAGSIVGSDEFGRQPQARWSLPNLEPEPSHDVAISAVREAVLRSVREPSSDSLAVAFSGGVDSAIVAAGVPKAPCYVAGFEGCHDISAAREAAEAMDRDLCVVEFDHDDIVRAVPEIARATGRTNAMDIQIALPLYFTAKQAAADGFDRLAVGQGADELFGGYRKVIDPAADNRVEAETIRGATREVMQSLPTQLPRDVLTLRAAEIELVAPLLHDRVVKTALRLPAALLATKNERKIALRRATVGVVPDPVRSADKKAVQYGTYAARELDRLARQAGYKRRMEDHIGQYIDSVLNERKA